MQQTPQEPEDRRHYHGTHDEARYCQLHFALILRHDHQLRFDHDAVWPAILGVSAKADEEQVLLRQPRASPQQLAAGKGVQVEASACSVQEGGRGFLGSREGWRAELSAATSL